MNKKATFKKGKWLEDFFKKNLNTQFVILRNPPEEYSKESYQPDFLVKHISSKIIFNIECKYRTYVNNQNHDYDFNEDQLLRFDNECKESVLYLIGFGINGNKEIKLKDLFLVPLIELNPLMSSLELQHYKMEMNEFEKSFITHYYE